MGDKIEYRVDTITDADDEFFEILTGKFMKALGRSRRAFTINELPITMDASELVSEGDEMIRAAEESLVEKEMKLYLAYR